MKETERTQAKEIRANLVYPCSLDNNAIWSIGTIDHDSLTKPSLEAFFFQLVYFFPPSGPFVIVETPTHPTSCRNQRGVLLLFAGSVPGFKGWEGVHDYIDDGDDNDAQRPE